jgi:hypothetical protein
MWKNDLSYLSIPVTKIDTRTRGEAKTKEAFAKFPLSWARRIGVPKHAATYPLAVFLVYQNWRHRGEPITVSNLAVEKFGINRKQKPDALRELADLGLIRVSQSGKAAPRVQILTCPPECHAGVRQNAIPCPV